MQYLMQIKIKFQKWGGLLCRLALIVGVLCELRKTVPNKYCLQCRHAKFSIGIHFFESFSLLV